MREYGVFSGPCFPVLRQHRRIQENRGQRKHSRIFYKVITIKMFSDYLIMHPKCYQDLVETSTIFFSIRQKDINRNTGSSLTLQ